MSKKYFAKLPFQKAWKALISCLLKQAPDGWRAGCSSVSYMQEMRRNPRPKHIQNSPTSLWGSKPLQPSLKTFSASSSSCASHMATCHLCRKHMLPSWMQPPVNRPHQHLLPWLPPLGSPGTAKGSAATFAEGEHRASLCNAKVWHPAQESNLNYRLLLII